VYWTSAAPADAVEAEGADVGDAAGADAGVDAAAGAVAAGAPSFDPPGGTDVPDDPAGGDADVPTGCVGDPVSRPAGGGTVRSLKQ
jgi:hypothetical protein